MVLTMGQDQQAPPAPPSPSQAVQGPATPAQPRPAAEPDPLPRALPVRLEIPSIGVRTDVVQLGLEADRTIEVPTDPKQAGWYRYSPTPGQVGPAVVVGHVDSVEGPAVFHELGALQLDARIRVLRDDGRVAVFSVRRVATYEKDAFPTRAVYGDLKKPGLRLITCGGSYDADDGGYQANSIVFASLVRVERAASDRETQASWNP